MMMRTRRSDARRRLGCPWVTDHAVHALEPRMMLSLQGPNDPPPAHTPSSAERLIGLDRLRADPRFDHLDGKGLTAVILDDGLDRDHPFFGPDLNRNRIADRILYSFDFSDNDGDISAASPHGSNVTSIIGSSDAVHLGVAPAVNLIHLKVFSDRPGADADTWKPVERALRWVVSNIARYNIVSVNMSLGGGNYSAPPPPQVYGIADELTALAERNVIVTAASGNSFDSNGSITGLSYPAIEPSVLAVGAVFDSAFGRFAGGRGGSAQSTGPDRIAPFSQRLPGAWQIFAPGVRIAGAGLDGGWYSETGTSQASPHVAGAVVLMQQLADSILGRRLTLGEFRTLMQRTGKKIVDGDDERDEVRNTGAAFRRLDVFALAGAIWKMAGPEISLRQDVTAIKSGGSTINFGSATQGTSIEKLFTITNTGVKPLVIGRIRVPTGFTLASAPLSRIEPGSSSNFLLRLDAASAASLRGTVRIDCNDRDERNTSFGVTGVVTPVSVVTDDGNPGTNFIGPWTTPAGRTGYGGDQRIGRGGGDDPVIVDWTFSNLIPGRYRVSATWAAADDLARAATYLLIDGFGVSDQVTINQRISPADRSIGGTKWKDLTTIDVTGDELIVTLDTEFANGPVAADAVRIERLGPLLGEAHLAVTVGAASAVDDGLPINIGSTNSGRPVQKSIVIRNVGGAALNIGGITQIPAGFSIIKGPAPVLKPGTSTTVVIQLDAGAAGDKSGALVIASSDPDDPEFHLNIAGKVAPVFRVIDNGDAGFAATGAWTSSRFGYRSDGLSAAPASGAAASWSFTRLVPGVYRVSAAWSGSSAINTSLASNTPVRICTGAGLRADVTIDQRTGPDSEQIQGSWWRHLGEFRVAADAGASTGSLMMLLTSLADAIVVADAFRVERVDN